MYTNWSVPVVAFDHDVLVVVPYDTLAPPEVPLLGAALPEPVPPLALAEAPWLDDALPEPALPEVPLLGAALPEPTEYPSVVVLTDHPLACTAYVSLPDDAVVPDPLPVTTDVPFGLTTVVPPWDHCEEPLSHSLAE